MIIVKLTGGLGNQLFQYAFGRALAIKHGTGLKTDSSGLNTKELAESGTVREMELGRFGANVVEASSEELKPYQKGKAGKILDLFLLLFGKNKLYVREPHFHFFKNALKAPSDCYLDGYWQSEKYFNQVREELLEELVPRDLSTRTLELAEEMRSANSVSIHVRRGDYLSNPQNRELYATCDETYYSIALIQMVALVGKCTYYVFSDEPEWFRKHCGVYTENVVYVTHNVGKDSYQDLYLMSQCKHNIIANSSFSWWGAWLNKNAGKTVIAPAEWFKNNSKDTLDLIPESWIRI